MPSIITIRHFSPPTFKLLPFISNLLITIIDNTYSIENHLNIYSSELNISF